VVGGIGAAVFLRIMFGTVSALGATMPRSGVASGKALAMEVVLTVGPSPWRASSVSASQPR
jgi:aquaporin Z